MDDSLILAWNNYVTENEGIVESNRKVKDFVDSSLKSDIVHCLMQVKHS
jgi:hypothetical protein